MTIAPSKDGSTVVRLGWIEKTVAGLVLAMIASMLGTTVVSGIRQAEYQKHHEQWRETVNERLSDEVGYTEQEAEHDLSVRDESLARHERELVVLAAQLGDIRTTAQANSQRLASIEAKLEILLDRSTDTRSN